MFVLIEVDKDFSVGIDIGRYLFGLRLGFIGIHIGFVKFTDFLDAANKTSKK
jgi:hypothetical protein